MPRKWKHWQEIFANYAFMANGDIGLRVGEALRARAPMRAVDLARALGFSDSSKIGKWVKGHHDPKPELLGLIAEALSISADWLRTGAGPMNMGPTDKPVYRGGLRFIPIYGAISAGPPANIAGDVVEWYETRDWGTEFDRWGRVVSGYSMEPILHPGDYAIFENRRWEPGMVVHAFRDGEDTVKRIAKVGEIYQLCPINPEYDIIPSDGWIIKGVCIGYVRKEADGAIMTREYPFGLRPKVFS